MQHLVVVCAFIHKDGKVFSPRRAKSKQFLPDKFELPGGHVDPGEDVVAGLKRELIEEFDAEIEVGDPFYAFTYENKVKRSHSVEIMYFAKFITPESEIHLKPDEHSEYKWLSKREAEELLEKDDEYKGIMRGFEILDSHSKITTL